MSETQEQGSTIARYIARFRQAQPQAPEQRRRTPREEFWWVQTRPDADTGSGLSRRSVKEDEGILPSASVSGSVASSSLSSWRMLDQSHEEDEHAVTPAPVVLADASAPMLQEPSQVVQVDAVKEERTHHEPSLPDVYAEEEQAEEDEDDEDAESVIQRVRERLGWHGSSSSSRSSLGSMSSSLFTPPLAYADVDSVASSMDDASAASPYSVAQLDEATQIKRSMEPWIRADTIRNQWPEEEEKEEKTSLASSSDSSRQEQQMVPSHALQTNLQEVDEAESDESGCISASALVEADLCESMTDESELEVLPQDTDITSPAETKDPLESVPSLVPSKSPVPQKRSSDAHQPGMQVAPLPRRSASSSSSSSTLIVQEAAVATVDNSGETTAETAQTLDRLVSFVVQSWSKDLFESDDLFETASPIASTQKTSDLEAHASVSPVSEQEESNPTQIDAGGGQDLSLVEEPKGVEPSQMTAIETADCDVLVVNTEDEATDCVDKQEHEQADNEFDDDEVICMLRQRIALYEEALRRIDQQ